MIARARPVAAGLAALAILMTAVAGLPIVLYRYGGSPLPVRVAGWHRLAGLLASRDEARVLLTVVRDCAWLAWLVVTACVLAEAQAVIRGRRAPRLGLGGIQGAAAHLVALAALAFSAPTVVPLPVSAAQLVTLDSLTMPGTAAPASTVIVHSGDCLWSIAQHYLGAGDRYPEIARLNYGRDMGDGVRFTNASVIQPGWRLLLPATVVRADQASSPKQSSGQHHGHPTKDPRFTRRHPAAHDQGSNGVASTRSSGPGRSTSAVSARADSVAVTRPTAEQTAQVPESAVFISGALAGAIIATLARLRFRQRQERARWRRIVLPADPDVLATEQRLRAAAQGERVPTLGDALAMLEAGVRGNGQALPDIVGVHVTPDLLEVLLAAPAADAPPAPYEVSPGRQGMCWQLALPAMAARAADCHVLPGLVTAGVTSAGYLLLDLESLQVTGCDGPADLVDEVITTIATELATEQWSGWYELILVGFGELASLGRAETCETLDEALSILESRCARTADRFLERAPADVRELRLAEPDDEDWGLTVVVSRTEPSQEQLTRLLDLAVESWGGIAALVPGDGEAADGRMAPTALQLAPDPEAAGGVVANVVPLQVTVRPRVLSAAEYAAIASLFGAAADVCDVAPEERPYTAYRAPPWIPQAATLRPEAEQDQPWPDPVGGTDGSAGGNGDGGSLPAGSAAPGDVDVRILGPLVISGAAEQLLPKQAELVLALALAAPAGLSNAALCSMLGTDPDRPKPSEAVRQIITRTRRRLGPAADGQERIIHAGGGQYRLHADVSLDWSRFRELTRSGQADDLRAALALVRGEPFAATYFWWIDIPLIETVRAEIVDAAETLAELELAAGSPRAASRAGMAGLAAEASAEQLWRVVMRAEHAAGNLAGVAQAWRHCLDAIEDIAPGGEPHPDTAALYRRLTSATPQHARLT